MQTRVCKVSDVKVEDNGYGLTFNIKCLPPHLYPTVKSTYVPVQLGDNLLVIQCLSNLERKHRELFERISRALKRIQITLPEGSLYITESVEDAKGAQSVKHAIYFDSEDTLITMIKALDAALNLDVYSRSVLSRHLQSICLNGLSASEGYKKQIEAVLKPSTGETTAQTPNPTEQKPAKREMPPLVYVGSYDAEADYFLKRFGMFNNDTMPHPPLTPPPLIPLPPSEEAPPPYESVIGFLKL